MKKIFLSIILVISILRVFAQDNKIETKIYHNEFGVDATGFLKQFLIY